MKSERKENGRKTKNVVVRTSFTPNDESKGIVRPRLRRSKDNENPFETVIFLPNEKSKITVGRGLKTWTTIV